MGFSALVFNRANRFRFTGVFGRMMSAVSSVENEKAVSPWLMLRPWFERGRMVYPMYSVEDKNVVNLREVGHMHCPRIVGSSYGWLATMELSCGSLHLSEPIGRRQVQLPSLSVLPYSYNFVSRMIISGSPDDDHCRALIIYGAHRSLAFCVPGHTDTDTWFPLISQGVDHKAIIDGEARICCLKQYQNIAYSNKYKLFFCIAKVHYVQQDGWNKEMTLELESWDLSNPAAPKVERILGPNFKSLNFDSANYKWPGRSEEESRTKLFVCLQFKYLVVDEASGQLFLVVRHVIPLMHPDGTPRRSIFYSEYRGWDHSYGHKTIGFDVFRVDIEHQRVSHMESLDGLALFVGLNHPFVVRPTPTSRLKADSIYFTDLPEHLSWHYKDHDNGIFDYVSKSFSKCHPSYPIDLASCKPKRRPIQKVLSDPLPFWYTPVSDLSS